ncbi:MAG: hypothetical protein AVO35_00150 [Candidatus Aegiribacteria sp. MLS_C]|nr:MAG: hypothetical protein AVO35_00150 [Candidatus Aegiribacteria sp. MLS_C]
MRISFTLLFLTAAIASAQFIENSCPAPGDHITGITEGVFAVDSMLDVVFHMNGWTGEVYDTIPLPFTGFSPVGLAMKGDSLMFAGSGTAMIYVMSVYGDSIGTYDVSDSGIYSISGLSCPWEDLFIADDSTNIVWRTDLPLGSGPFTQFLALEGCPQIHDIGVVYYDQVAVACEDSVSPVRIYWGPSDYEPIWFQPGECESAVGVGTCGEGNRFWFSDPEMGMIHRYCCDMGGVSGDEPEHAVEVSMPNPVSGSAVVSVQLPSPGEVSITVTDMAGRTVAEAFTGHLPEGDHQVPLNMEGHPAGTYILRVTRSDVESTCQFTLLK